MVGPLETATVAMDCKNVTGFAALREELKDRLTVWRGNATDKDDDGPAERP